MRHLPAPLGRVAPGRTPAAGPRGGIVRVRLDTTDADIVCKFNRTEHLRAIPTDDEDWARLYPRRSDAESINCAWTTRSA
ncbi:MAG: hypothetical protein ACRD0S_06740, partial [Acidimicrobiales bacterium]